ncbi:MAG: ClpXP protease specificity-enhancing factor SspB [Rickettsiaceae bacterium]|nr:ClpXP protease specificity-enhancing factor SspB [Rickettsiaceae bacterium]
MAVDYQSLIDEAMLAIVRKVLLDTQDNGLGDDQCFYISFRTDYPEVILSRHVRQRYPKEITIVLQYQYKNLQVLQDRFSVNIAFNSIPETIEIPFSALTGFVDPSVNFSLQFRKNNEDEYVEDSSLEKESKDSFKTKPKINSTTKEAEKKAGEVIAIDKCRKKTK